jgi:ubiquinone/menaquinone biosynthesis C-methylase UbiE
MNEERRNSMSKHVYGEAYGGTAPENYQRYFVPAIGRPVAEDLLQVAALRPGERVLDVACGTGVVTRLAAERVGPNGSVAGLDLNPGMLAVARSATPSDLSIDWYQSSAEAMPLSDEGFDVVLCQMGLQFMQDKASALREMRRVLVPSGRLVLNLPGPTPVLFSIFEEALARHIDPQAAAFANVVFSLHDADRLRELMQSARLRDINIQQTTKALRLPLPRDFMWQYIHSTPLGNVVSQADEPHRAALEREVCEKWQEFVVGGVLTLSVGMTTATALK